LACSRKIHRFGTDGKIKSRGNWITQVHLKTVIKTVECVWMRVCTTFWLGVFAETFVFFPIRLFEILMEIARW